LVDKSELPTILADIQICLDVITDSWNEIVWDKYMMTRLKQVQKALNDIVVFSRLSPEERNTLLEFRKLKREMATFGRISERTKAEVEELKKSVSLVRGEKVA
jgi:hypothetical protein